MPPRGRYIAVVHTRPAPLISALKNHGYEGLPCPTLTIQPVTADLTIYKDRNAILLTSAHAISAAKELSLPVIAVGQTTAKAAQDAGLKVMAMGAGDAVSLLKLNLNRYRLLHLCGKHLAPGTRGVVEMLEIPSVCVYEAAAQNALPEEIINALNGQELAGALVFSARAAQVFTGLAKRGTNMDLWRHVHGVAFSPRVMAAMNDLPFLSLRAAAAPNRNSILEAFINV